MTRQRAHAVPHRTRLRPRGLNAIGGARNKLSHATLPVQNISEPRDNSLAPDLFAYQGDFWERLILFFDTLRQRADDMLAHECADKPPLLL